MDSMEWDSSEEDYDLQREKDFLYTRVKKVDVPNLLGYTITKLKTTRREFDKEKQDYLVNMDKHEGRRITHTASWRREKSVRPQLDTSGMYMDNQKTNLPARPAKSYFTGDISKISDKQTPKDKLPTASILEKSLSLRHHYQGEKGTKNEESSKDQCSQKLESKETKSKYKIIPLYPFIQESDIILQTTIESEQKHEEIPQTKKIESASAYNVVHGSHNFSPLRRLACTDYGFSQNPCSLPLTDTSSSNESDDQRGPWSEIPEQTPLYRPLAEKLSEENKEKENNEKIMKSKKQQEKPQQRKIIRARRKILPCRGAIAEVTKPDAKQMDTESSYRIVIVGTVGSGKSSLGNSLLGKQYFETGISGSSVTRKCTMGESLNHGKHITVVDTIGYTSEVLKKSKILKAFDKISPGPHAVLNVIPFSERFTTEFFSSIQQFVNLVGKEVYNFLVIVLTHEDQLKMRNLTIKEFIDSSPTKFKELLNRCENRIFAINNGASDEAKHEKVERLIKIIDTIKRKHTCFETYDEFLF